MGGSRAGSGSRNTGTDPTREAIGVQLLAEGGLNGPS